MARNPASGGLAKIIITNSTSANNGIIDKEYLAYADKDIKTIINGIKSAINPNSYFSVKRKKIDQASGIFEVEVYVSASEAENAYRAGSYIMGNLNHRDEEADKNISYNVTKEEQTAYRAGVITLHGRKAQKIAKEAVLPQGGMLIPPPAGSESDKWNYVIPVPEGSDSSYVGEMLHGARAESLTVVRNTALKESARDKASEKRKELANYKKYMSGIEAEQHKTGRMYANDVWDDFVQEEKAKAKEEKSEEKALGKVGNFALAKIVALLTAVVDISRRILASVMDRATKSVGEAITAGSLGISYSRLRKLAVQEKALGIEEGTNISAMEDLQSKFGNISNLDTASLEALALVMGGDVKDFVMSGQGGKNSEALRNMIINSFAGRALSGYNSVGQFVGRENATRELVSYLAKISPDLSKLLATFIEYKTNPNSIYKNAGSYEELLSSVKVNRGNFGNVEEGLRMTAGMFANSLKAEFEDLIDSLSLYMSSKLVDILERLDNNTFGESADQKIIHYEKNREANIKTLAELASEKESKNKSVQDIIEKSTDNAVLQKMSLSRIIAVASGDMTPPSGVSKEEVEAFYSKLLLNDDILATAMYVKGISYWEQELVEQNNKKKTDKRTVTPARIKEKGSEQFLYTLFGYEKGDVRSGQNKPLNELTDVERSILERAMNRYYDSLSDSEKKEFEKFLEEKGSNKAIYGKKSKIQGADIPLDVFYRMATPEDENIVFKAGNSAFEGMPKLYLDAEIEAVKSIIYGDKPLHTTGEEGAMLHIQIEDSKGIPLEKLEYEILGGKLTRLDNSGDTIRLDMASMMNLMG